MRATQMDWPGGEVRGACCEDSWRRGRRQHCFSELCNLLERLGFEQRIRGSHHIFTKDAIAEILNLQPKGRNAKPYQVKQVRTVIVKYRLAGGTDGQ
jgi:predicted RNA binding protein YcfA (HicA-like mRNA interferase family)